MLHICGGVQAAIVICDELAVVTRVHVIVVLEGAAAQQPRPLPLQENSLESLAELRVEDAVDDGIERRVRVAEPREDLEGGLADARFTEGRNDVDTEKGHPAHFARRDEGEKKKRESELRVRGK